MGAGRDGLGLLPWTVLGERTAVRKLTTTIPHSGSSHMQRARMIQRVLVPCSDTVRTRARPKSRC